MTSACRLQADLDALVAAEAQLAQVRADREARNLIPTEPIPEGNKTRESLHTASLRWADMFSPRQLLGFGTLMDERDALRPTILAEEGAEIGEAMIHLLGFVLEELANWTCILSSWNVKCAHSSVAVRSPRLCFQIDILGHGAVAAGGGLGWAMTTRFRRSRNWLGFRGRKRQQPVDFTQGSATSLIHLGDHSLDAVVVDPPYADNVQYSELADFFYVWLKRTQGIGVRNGSPACFARTRRRR